MLADLSERGVYASYLIGELHVDDFDQYDGPGTDTLEDDDATTSSRQRIEAHSEVVNSRWLDVASGGSGSRLRDRRLLAFEAAESPARVGRSQGTGAPGDDGQPVRATAMASARGRAGRREPTSPITGASQRP